MILIIQTSFKKKIFIYHKILQTLFFEYYSRFYIPCFYIYLQKERKGISIDANTNEYAFKKRQKR